MQEEVPGGSEPCTPTGGSASTSFQTDNANGVSYTVDLTMETGAEFLEIGQYVEVELDFNDVMAALRSDSKGAIALAAEVGIRPPVKGSVVRASNTLTDAEYRALATYVTVAVQNSNGRATGRSDSALDRFVRRVDAAAQAFGRAMDSIGRNIPNLDTHLRVRINYPSGQSMVEVDAGANVSRNP
ncbi:hypothetical protein GCM10009116_10120 [Brevundimonas basaltis]